MKLISSDVPTVMTIAAPMGAMSVLFFTIYCSSSVYKNVCSTSRYFTELDSIIIAIVILIIILVRLHGLKIT